MRDYVKKRRGLPQVARHVGNRPIVVGYLGGSLTMMKQGWRPMFHQWLNQAHPASEPHRAINAARGGVGSATGAFLIGDAIAGNDPDLIFVEYAINDSFDFLTPPDLRTQFVEGILHNIWTQHPNCDICLIYMHHIQRGDRIRKVVEEYERIADHYGIPSIHVGQYLIDLVSTGKWSFLGESPAPPLLKDECHPLGQGNRLVSEMIAGAFRQMLENSATDRIASPTPLSPNPLSGGRILPVEPEMIKGRYRIETGCVGNFPEPVTRYCMDRDSWLEIRVPHTVIGLYAVVGPTSGIMEMQTEDGETKSYTLFDEWCHYQRASTCILVENGSNIPRMDQPIKIRLTDKRPDYAICPKLESAPRDCSLDVFGLLVI